MLSIAIVLLIIIASFTAGYHYSKGIHTTKAGYDKPYISGLEEIHHKESNEFDIQDKVLTNDEVIEKTIDGEIDRGRLTLQHKARYRLLACMEEKVDGEFIHRSSEEIKELIGIYCLSHIIASFINPALDEGYIESVNGRRTKGRRYTLTEKGLKRLEKSRLVYAMMSKLPNTNTTSDNIDDVIGGGHKRIKGIKIGGGGQSGDTLF